mmetsp:Transcript_4491/g.11690  ORF Transcript_4491/g.11690 Transcript_4491/m.11690 type:complete len:630 (-) Transcript_4491:570-2459(-)
MAASNMFWCDIVPGKLAHAAKGVDPDAMASNAQAALRKFAPKAVLDLAPPTETANGDHEKELRAKEKAWRKISGAVYAPFRLSGDFDADVCGFMARLSEMCEGHGVPLMLLGGGSVLGAALVVIALEAGTETTREKATEMVMAAMELTSRAAKQDLARLFEIIDEKHSSSLAFCRNAQKSSDSAGGMEKSLRVVCKMLTPPTFSSSGEVVREVFARRILRQGREKALPLDVILHRVGLTKSEGEELGAGDAIASMAGVARFVDDKTRRQCFYIIENKQLRDALASVAPNSAEVESEWRQIVGEFIFPYVEVWYAPAAAKLTGMLLEMDVADSLHLADHPPALDRKLEQALQVLVDAGKAIPRPPKQILQRVDGDEASSAKVPWGDMASRVVLKAAPHTSSSGTAAPSSVPHCPWRVGDHSMRVDAAPFVHIDGNWPSLYTARDKKSDPHASYCPASDGEGDDEGEEWESLSERSDSPPPSRGLLGDDLMDSFPSLQVAADTGAEGDGGNTSSSPIQENGSSCDGDVEEDSGDDGGERDRLLDILQSQAKRESATEIAPKASASTKAVGHRNYQDVRVVSKKAPTETIEGEECAPDDDGEQEEKFASPSQGRGDVQKAAIKDLLQELDNL